MEIVLRDYQKDSVVAVAEAYRRGIRRSLIALPTGTGKTVVFATIIKGAAAKQNRCLVLAHRDELLQQAHDKLLDVAPELRGHVGFVQGGQDAYTKSVVIASVQTLARRRRILRLMDNHAASLDSRYALRAAPLADAEEDAAASLREARRDLAQARQALKAAATLRAELSLLPLDETDPLMVAVELAAATRDLCQTAYDHAKAAREEELFRTLDGRWPFGVVIVDEAHHAQADTYVETFRLLGCFEESGPMLVGVTATPQRADGRDLGDTFEEIVYHRDMLSMMRENYLCDLRGLRVQLAAFDTKALRVQAGDFVDADSEQALRDADAPKHVCEAWIRRAEGRKTIIFTPTIALAHEMADEFVERGIAAEAVSGVSMDERRAILDRFHRGATKVVTNAMVLTEGFDEPTVECIVVARPTKSQPLYVQMVGRGTRISPTTGKKDCLIIDVVGVSDRMDLTTLPKLFGLGEPEETTEQVGGEMVIAEATEGIIMQQERAVEEGRIVAKQVTLCQRNEMAWTCIRSGEWILNAGDATIAVTARPDGLWDVTRYERNGARRSIAEGLAQNYAMGTAEDAIRNDPSFVAKLVDRRAPWRSLPASPQQVERLEGWRVKIPRDEQGNPTLTRGEASDIMSAKIATWRMKGRRAAL